MASDGVPATIPASVQPAQQLQQLQQPQKASAALILNGKNSPPNGNAASTAAAATKAAAVKPAVQTASTQAAKAQSKTPTATNKADLQALISQLNKYVNDSGRPNQFRVDPNSRDQTIQEINPASGEVIGEFSASEFPALARSLGVSGVLVDDHA